MDENKKDLMPPAGDFLMEEPPLQEEFTDGMPEFSLEPPLMEEIAPQELPVSLAQPEEPVPDASQEAALETEPEAEPETVPDTARSAAPQETVIFEPVSSRQTEAPALAPEPFPEEPAVLVPEDLPQPEPAPLEYVDAEPENTAEAAFRETEDRDFNAAFQAAPVEPEPLRAPRQPAPKKGRPKRKKGYGLFGLPHLLATLVWLAIIVMIGTSLGRMLWVCAADVLAFGRESKKVSITITSNDTIDDIAEKLHDAELVRYPGLFKLYASLAVDDGDILPGTFEMDTLYDYHALVVQMGPRSSNRSVIEDVLIPEGLNCRQIFELLEQHNICTVAELEEYAANGEFGDYWFLEGVERGDKYCLEGFLFPDTYDFYIYSTPREALGKLLNGFEYRFTQEIYDQLPALNERLSAMMRAKGCSEEYIAENQLDLRDLLTVASLIEEETASSKESPMIASVIFNRLTEDQMYERYLNIDAAIIYATGDPNHIDTSIDHPYNTYKYAGLTPGPISNPGLESIQAALNFEDSQYYYYVLNPETGMHQFSKTLEEHEKWVEEFRNMSTEETE